MRPGARLEARIWSSDFSRYGGRRKRGSFHYQAYIPAPIAELELSFPGDVAAVVNEAERAISLLNQDPPRVPVLETLARQLLRVESLASSRIEGLILSHRRLARAAADPYSGADANAQSVVGNIAAMERAIEIGASADQISPGHLIQIHETLFRGTRDEAIAGTVRLKQNWIGGDSDTPRKADFIPPPPGFVNELLGDLAEFLNRDDLPVIAQAAIAHAQFETIHPFPDGNGRVGRCLIHVLLKRRDLAPRYVPPISLILATDVSGYVKGLTDFRSGRDEEWIAVFAQASRSAADEAEGLAERIGQLQGQWTARAASPRRNSASSKLIAALPGYPVIDTATAVEIAGVSDVAAGRAIARLEKAGILRLDNKARHRGRIWEARELFELINDFERQLASSPRDTQPARPAPAPPHP